MLRKRPLVMVLACATVWCQETPSQQQPLARANPSDLKISCRLNESARTGEVTITNVTDKRCYFARSGPLIDYRVAAISETGKPVRELTIREAVMRSNPSLKFFNMRVSKALITLNPEEAYTASVPLSDHIVIPREGGRFMVRIGQVLFEKPGSVFDADPTEVIWCDRMAERFPALR